MKIDELIKLLEKVKNDLGNIEVKARDVTSTLTENIDVTYYIGQEFIAIE
jgi:hypothetical protein